MKGLLVTLFYLLTLCFVSGFEIRLWPVNGRGNEGFVEAYHEGTWGMIGSPAFRFSDETASFLCRTLGLSEYGYSSGWTSVDNYGGFVWTYGLVCNGNETDIEQCHMTDKWAHHDYSNQTDWAYRHGTRLFCVDATIKSLGVQNKGPVETFFDGKRYTLCAGSIDMNGANVLCNHLGYDGAVSIEDGESDGTELLYPNKISCKGCEYSLSECDRSEPLNGTCYATADVTCKAVRLARMNKYTDEGPVEVFYNGSWGFVGDPGFAFDDITASHLCKRFGISDVGFSTMGHSLGTYGRKAWLNKLYCKHNETNVLNCQHGHFGTTPILMHTYQRGTWLYCFDFNITDYRLTFGATPNEGRVEVKIGGRWGLISTYGAQNTFTENAGKIACRLLGYSGLDTVFYNDNVGRSDDLFWMWELICDGDETSFMDCHHFKKGNHVMGFAHAVYLRVRCTSGSGSAIVG